MGDWKEALAMFDAIAADARVLPENAASALRAKATIRAHIEGLEADKAAMFIRAREWATRSGEQEQRAEAAERDAGEKTTVLQFMRDRLAPYMDESDRAAIDTAIATTEQAPERAGRE